MKKAVCTLLVLVMCLMAFSVVAFASSGTLTITSSASTATVGDEVVFTITASTGSSTIGGMEFGVVMSDGLELVSSVDSSASLWTMSNYNESAGQYTAFTGGYFIEESPWTVLTITCKVVEAGTQTVTLTGVLVFDDDYEDLDMSVSAASVTVSEVEVTPEPTAEPTAAPTAEPTAEPTAAPTDNANETPSGEPGGNSSEEPNGEETPAPTSEATAVPSATATTGGPSGTGTGGTGGPSGTGTGGTGGPSSTGTGGAGNGTTGSAGGSSNSPQTADETNISLWIVLIAVFGIGACVTVVKVLKKEN